ncbi:MAG TPA: glycosyltransferase family 9 protein [Chitinophagaceae bacterium]|nr:glycosyltransferase family 9 protein [Chitinophagaceae bacterium]
MKNILCIRADNMGDLIMSSPAIRALKRSFNARITVLTSSMGAGIAPYIPCIDEVIVYDLPWIKTDHPTHSESFFAIVNQIKERRFDAAVIFTVFSQNPLPAAMLAYLAGIPKRVAFCRENPYELLTHWIPDKEPYDFIQHQVMRDLQLVQQLGANAVDDSLSLQIPADAWYRAQQKLKQAGINEKLPWLVLHAPVSEKKREFPPERWAEIARKLVHELSFQVVLTGTSSERNYTQSLQQLIGNNAFSVAGLFTIDELIALVANTSVLLSVNTGPVHIAAAVNTPVVVLYALTNPQHTPWKVLNKVLYFDVPASLQSKNEVLRYVYHHVMEKPLVMPSPDEITDAVRLIASKSGFFVQSTV